MQKIAEENNFRKIFFGDPEIGGRYSAMSPFGMAAGAAMGLDVESFLQNAGEMVAACKTENPAENPGAILGIILGVCNLNGRDKLTIFTSPEIYDLGAWLEQLIAESTGKQGKSIIPIDLEQIAKPEDYTDDRVFAYLKLKDSSNKSLDEKVALLRDSGMPTVEITLENKMNLGQEFFRWEFATAVAGAIMNINPFNQPDVESAKIEAKKLTEEYEQTGELPTEEPIFEEDGIKLFTSEEYAESIWKNLSKAKKLCKNISPRISRIYRKTIISRCSPISNATRKIRKFYSKSGTKFLKKNSSPPRSVSDRVFCIRPDRLTKAARITAFFCKSLRTTRKISMFRNKNLLSVSSKRHRRAAIFRFYWIGKDALCGCISVRM